MSQSFPTSVWDVPDINPCPSRSRTVAGHTLALGSLEREPCYELFRALQRLSEATSCAGGWVISDIPSSFRAPLAFQEEGGRSEPCLSLRPGGFARATVSSAFFCCFPSLFSCPGVLLWPDEFLNKNMVRREQEKGGENPGEDMGGGEKPVLKTRVIPSGSLGCVFNFKIPTSLKSCY